MGVSQLSNNDFKEWDKLFEDDNTDNNIRKDVTKEEDNNKINDQLNQDIKNSTENKNVNPFMKDEEKLLVFGLFSLSAIFLWRGLNVIIGIGLNLFIALIFFLGAVVILVKVNDRVRSIQNVPHKCSNCGKTMAVTPAQENYLKSGNTIMCPFCKLPSK